MINVGTAITYADSATLGATFSVAETAIYALKGEDRRWAGVFQFGVSKNSTQLTTDIYSITAADRLVAAVA